MNSNFYLLADFDFGLEDVLAPWRSMSSSALGAILLLCAMGLVALLAVVWAAFFRSSRRRRRSHHHSHRHSSSSIEAVEPPSPESSPSPPQQHHGRRHSRRRHRPRNPTLAETGGLPPVRPEGSTCPCSRGLVVASQCDPRRPSHDPTVGYTAHGLQDLRYRPADRDQSFLSCRIM